VNYRYKVTQYDVKNAFVHADIDKELYIQLPTGLFTEDKYLNKVGKLNKALYGLKQSPRLWYKYLSDILTKKGFIICPHDEAVFIDPVTGIIIIGHVDDFLISSKSENALESLENNLKDSIQLDKIGTPKVFLANNIRINYKSKEVWIDQIDYTNKILRKYGIIDSYNKNVPNQLGLYNKPQDIPGVPGLKLYKNTEKATLQEIEVYQSQVGSLIYLALKTRPDITFAVNYCARFMSNPNKDHCLALNRIWNYLLRNPDLGLYYDCTGELLLKGYCDADWAADLVNRKSTTGYITSLSKDHYEFDSKRGKTRQTKWNTNIISWNSKLQTSIAQSTCEAEYYALKEVINEIVYLTGFITWISKTALNNNKDYKPTILIDNEGARKLAENPEFHKRTKHIDIMYHYIREVVSTKKVSLVHIPSKYEIADILTKNLAREAHEDLKEMANVRKI
jgi:hypothetical protein